MNKQQLDQLLTESQAITQELMSIRNSVLNKTYNTDYQLGSEFLSKACEHRQYLRRLAETLQANRGLAQLNKQKIQKSRVMLQGLDYFKKTLKDKIQGYHTDVDSIDNYFEEPIGHIDWEKDYESGQQRLKQSLEKLKMKDQMYRNSLLNKQKLEKQIQEKSKLFNVLLPRNIKKLNEQVVQITKLFGIDANEGLEKIENIQLAYIFDTLKTLMRIEKIDVRISKQEHQYIDLVIKPCGFDLYERCLQYGIKLQQKQIKIRISSMKPQFSKLVVGVDRRSDFSNRDIFHRLMNRQDIKLVFQNPLNETQRNVNNRFVYVDWLQGALCTEAVKCANFIDLVRTRVFTTALIKNILQSFKNPVWLSTITPAVYSQISSKKISVENIQKISFIQYKNSIKINYLVKKSLNQYQQKQLQKDKKDEEYLLFQKNKKQFIEYLQRLGMQQLIVPEIYSYYRIVINYKSLKAVCILLVAFQYPEISPKIKVISLQRSMQNQPQQNPIGQIQCKVTMQTKQMLSHEIQIVEKQSNSPFSMLNEGIKDPFGVVYYLAKLLNSIYAIQNVYVERNKAIK